MLYKRGQSGEVIRQIQVALGIDADGIFGAGTEQAVIAFQKANGLTPDGLVGEKTLNELMTATTDNGESVLIEQTTPYRKITKVVNDSLKVTEFFLPHDEYKKGPINAEYVFLHHTAGWHNPYSCISQWGRDSRGAVATEFVMGGQSVKDGNADHDGVVVQAFPQGNWGYHLGKNGSSHMHKNSIGIEVCNFGWIKDGKTYANVVAADNQIVTLAEPFRGHTTWHRYSDAQIENLRLWLIWIAKRDGIDITQGLPALVKQHGAKAFEFNEDAYYGRVKGVWTHTNTRKDKVDMFPQQELLDMLESL